MKRIFLSVLSVVGCLSAHAQVNDLPRTSPEAMGLKSAQVSAFFDSLLAYPKTEIHSAIVMRHGKVVGEMYPAPFRPEYKHTQFSCSKTFVAAAVGIAIVSPESAPIKRIIQDVRERGDLIDATCGRRTRAVLVTDSEHIVLSAVQPETIAHRLEARESITDEEEEA